MSNEYKDWLRDEEYEIRQATLKAYKDFMHLPRNHIPLWEEMSEALFKAGMGYQKGKDNV